jgi:HEAT repeat protein
MYSPELASRGGIEMKSPVSNACAIAFFLFSPMIGAALGADTPAEKAWAILQANANEKSIDKRVQAIRVLALMPGNARAFGLAKKAAADEKPEVRAAAATVLGRWHGKSSVALLHQLLGDKEPSVALAAASALVPFKDPEAYETYYEFLTGERKTGDSLIAGQMKTMRDPKKMAEIGVEQGIGFIPYAGIGLAAFKTLRADDVSPVRAAAAKMLAHDPDPESGQALVRAASDKSWVVKAAALEAIARRGDPQLLDEIVPAMMDDNTSVRCTAAAAVIRLSSIGETSRKKP